MSGWESAQHDVARGDYGMARQRLASYLNSKGYDADVLKRLGQMCFDMHDPRQAGRYWLASSAEGVDAELAIESFIRDAQQQPRLLLARLPRAVREADFASLPPVAQDRLRQFGLDTVVGKPAPKVEQSWSWGARLISAFGFIVLLLLAGLSCVGFHTVIGWIRG